MEGDLDPLLGPLHDQDVELRLKRQMAQ